MNILGGFVTGMKLYLRIYPLLLVILSFLFLGISCTTTSGVFEVRASSETQQREAQEAPTSSETTRPSSSESTQSTLVITSDPPGAGVFLNGVFVGVTPLRIQNPPEPPFQLFIRKTGYRDHLSFYGGNQTPGTIQVELQRIVGFVSITGALPGRILLDGSSEPLEIRPGGLLEIPIGVRTLTLQRFGFRDQVLQITIREAETQTVNLQWIPQDLKLQSFRVSPSRFSPNSPGNLGSLEFEFSVSGPGIAQIEVLDREMNLVYQSPLIRLETWDHEYRWLGQFQQSFGSTTTGVAPNGLYYGQVRIFTYDVSSRSGLPGQIASQTQPVGEQGSWFVVDRGVTLYPRLIRGFGSGLLLVPTADIMIPLRFQYTLQGDGVFGSGLFRIPLSFGIRAGLFPGVELSFFGGGILREDPQDNQLTFGASLKALAVQSGPSWASGALGFTFSASHREFVSRVGMSNIDDQGDYPGIGGGLFGQLSFGTLAIHGAWEIRFADTLPIDSWDRPNPTTLGAWSYYRAGLSLQLPQVHLGLSGALRSQTLGAQVPNTSGDLSSLRFVSSVGWLGYEAHYHVPNSWLSLGIYGRTVIVSNLGAYTYGGGILSITPR